MNAIITIMIKDVDSWDQYNNFTIPQMESDLKEEVELAINPQIGFETINIEIK